MKFLASLLVLVAHSVVSASSYPNSFDLDRHVLNVGISHARFVELPVKSEVRPIPGCTTYNDDYPRSCEEVIVLETDPVIQVGVTYDDPRDTTSAESTASPYGAIVNFSVSEFSAEEVAEFKAARFNWRRPFSTKHIRIARKYFSLEVKNVQKAQQVIDYRNSTICDSYDNEGNPIPLPGCVQNVVYKTVMVWVKRVTVSRKPKTN